MNRTSNSTAALAVLAFVFLVSARYGFINVSDSARYLASVVAVLCALMSLATQRFCRI